MKETATSEEMLVRYLLGRMSEEERDRIDEQYFGDKDFIEQLLTVEDDLIDDYVRGELSPDDRKQFEEFFLRSPERQRRVAFARRWMTVVARSSDARKKAADAPRKSWRERFRISLPWLMVPVAASFLLATTCLWLGLRIARLNHELDDMRAAISAREAKEQELERQLADERRSSSELRDELARASSRPPDIVQPTGPPLAAFNLNPGLARSEGDMTKLVIPADASLVRLQANFKVGDYPSYSATLETAEGRRVWSRTGLKARRAAAGRMVILDIPAARLPEQDYVLTVNGIASTGEAESVGEYSFRVVRK